jgi:uncharacterized protein
MQQLVVSTATVAAGLSTSGALPQATLLFAGACALIQCVLTLLVIHRRLQSGIDLLDGGDVALALRIRAHGNFSETVPMALLLMLLLELKGVAAGWIAVLGCALLIGRTTHAICLLRGGPRWGRMTAMVITVTVLSAGGVACIWAWLR